MSNKETVKIPSLPAPPGVPRPGRSTVPPPGPEAIARSTPPPPPRKRTSTLQGPASSPPPVPIGARPPPPSTRPEGIPRPGLLPALEDGLPPALDASLDHAPPPIPSLTTPLPPAPTNDAAASDPGRRRSRRTVKIPNDATPSSSPAPGMGADEAAAASDRRSDPGERESAPERSLAPPDDVVIRPMMIFEIASDLPAVEGLALPDFDGETTSVMDVPVVPPPASARVEAAPESGGDIEEIEPDRVSDPDDAAIASAAKAGDDAAATSAEPVELEPSSQPPTPVQPAAAEALADDIPVHVEEVGPPSISRKPPPPPPKASRSLPQELAPASSQPPASPPASARAPASEKAPPSAQAAAAAATAALIDPGGRKRPKPWWEELFGDDYIRTMDRPEPKYVRREVDFIEESLGVEKGAVILDLACGAGAHAVELSSRGYSVVGYDLSLAMLARAADEAQGRGQKLNFLQGDMREMAFEEMFDGVYCWSTSFGYFDEERNASVLQRAHRALRQGGMLLLDIINRDYVAPRQPSLVWFEGEGCVCMDEMHVDSFTSRLRVKRTAMFEDGRSRELDYSIRLYALHELGQLLHDCGFKVVEVTGHPAHPGVFFGSESPRIIILAERG